MIDKKQVFFTKGKYMCDFCKIDTGLDYTITSKNSKVVICLNCVIKKL